MHLKESTIIAIIGAGPVGLAAAAHLAQRDETPVIFEAGSSVAASVRSWSHVQLFSPWRYVVDEAARALLEETGWVAPDPESYPTSHTLVERCLEPLAALPAIAPHLRPDHRVTALSAPVNGSQSGAGKVDRDHIA
jgi:2-polyprenyl-6-methoxyphenol hydroxylase-like FAD-dependent oxidoreductase